MKSTYRNIQTKTTFSSPSDWQRYETIDMHTAGEPLRVVVQGLPEINASSVLEYRRQLQQDHDHIRTALMFEPRGHADMYGCFLVPPNDDTADFGIVFIHNEGYSTMCGHAIIAITKLAVEMGWVEKTVPETKLEIDAPCGRITSFAVINDEQVQEVYFHCVPSFVLGLNNQIEVPKLGLVNFDLAYGGAFYAYVDADALRISLDQKNVREHIEIGMSIKNAIINSSIEINHPFEDDLSFLYGTILVSQNTHNHADLRNVCIFADGEVDRSPTGSGVAGHMALLHEKGTIAPGRSVTIESIIGTQFKGSVQSQVDYGPFKAVIPRVEGNAYVVGQNEWIIDPRDPLNKGFLLK